MRIIILICIFVFASYIPSYSLTDKEYKLLLQKSEDFRAADKKLTDLWKYIMSKSSEQYKNKIRAEQKEWIKHGRDEWAQKFMDVGLDREKAYTRAVIRRIHELEDYEGYLNLTPEEIEKGNIKAEGYYLTDEDSPSHYKKSSNPAIQDKSIPKSVFQKIIDNSDIAKLEKLISEGYNINLPLKQKNTAADIQEYPLVLAVQNNNIALVKFLLKHGADINKENSDPDNGVARAILIAADKYNRTMIKLLIDAGAQLSWSTEALSQGKFDGCLCSIINNNDLELLSYALQHGASPNSSSCAGDYCEHPMGQAAKHNNIEAMKILINNGGDVNYQDPYHTSALIVAIANSHPEMVKLILDNAGDVSKEGNTGEDFQTILPLELARQKKNPTILRLLQAAQDSAKRE